MYRVPSLDARELDHQELSQFADGETANLLVHRPMTASEIGCAVSHSRAYELIAESGAEWSLVMEDDARLTSSFSALPRILDSLRSSKPTVVQLWTYPDHAVVGPPVLTTLDDAGWEITIRRAITPPIGASAYVMNRAASVLAFERGEGRRIRGLADWPVPWAYDVDFLLAWPWLAEPDASAVSTIQNSRTPFEEAGFESRIAKLTRHVESALGLRYLRRREAYPGFRQFYRHEVIRPAALAMARWRGGRLGAEGKGPRTLTSTP